MRVIAPFDSAQGAMTLIALATAIPVTARACFQTRRSPLAPLNKGGKRALFRQPLLPLLRGMRGGSPGLIGKFENTP